MAAHVRRDARIWDGSGLRASDFRRAASDFRALGHPLAPRTDVWFPVRMRSRFTSLAVALLVLAACSKKSEPAPPPARPAPASAAPGTPFSIRDLAFATALDAKLARFSLVASDVQGALTHVATPATAQGGAGAARDRARMLLPRVDGALAEIDQALAGISHPGDRQQAVPARDAAKAYAGKLAAAASGDPAALAPEILSARDAFAAAIGQYRAARTRWRLDAPEPQGLERDFADARREAERVESAFGSRTRVAPREEGHELDPATARMTGLMAARRAREIAERLPNPLRGPAVAYAAAEERALEAVTGLAQAAEPERPALARSYHAAKVEALAALADYFAALSGR